jgi:hypothetical protein
MKRKALAIVLITVVALSIAVWVVYNQISAPNVKITAFSMDKGWENLGGLLLTCEFNITLRNMGLNDVDGLKLLVQMFVNDTEVEVVNHWWGCVFSNGSINDILRTGEVREVKGELLYSLHVGGAINTIGGHPIGASYVVKVMLGAIVLDERWAT